MKHEKYQFEFEGKAGRYGRLPGLIIPFDLEQIRKRCLEDIRKRPEGYEDINGDCECVGGYHTEECFQEQERDLLIDDGLATFAAWSQKRLWRMKWRDRLTKCAQNPARAVEEWPDTLLGMAQETCIYPIQ
jgi:hypothetical protein